MTSSGGRRRRSNGAPGAFRWAVLLVPLLATFPGCGGSPAPLGDKLSDARERFEQACSRCHSLDLPLHRRKSLEGWRQTVRAMRAHGARLTDEEADEVARYLTQIRGR